MDLVIDTNRLIAGLLKSSTSRDIILNDRFHFYAPDFLLIELEKHRDFLEARARITSDEFDTIFQILLEKITVMPFEEFKDDFHRAMEIMKTVDETDSAFLAVGMYLKLDGIWTEDKDFKKQDILKVYSTKDLLSLMNST